MNKYFLTFKRPDGTTFQSEHHGYDLQHATVACAVCLERSLGETGLVLVSYTK